MNERIKELAELATAYANNIEDGDKEIHFRNIFADLIVRDCASAAFTFTYGAKYSAGGGEVNEFLLQNAIKGHFGVE